MDQKNAFLGTEPIGRLLFRLAIPTVIAQLVNMLYNIVDRIYIGHIPVYGAAAGGIGSALADILSGYAVFAPGTFVIKALIAVIAAAILKALGSKTKAAPIVASIAGEAWMVLGYFLYESIFLRYGLAAAGSIGGNAIQAVAGVILASALYAVLSKVPQIKKAAA